MKDKGPISKEIEEKRRAFWEEGQPKEKVRDGLREQNGLREAAKKWGDEYLANVDRKEASKLVTSDGAKITATNTTEMLEEHLNKAYGNEPKKLIDVLFGDAASKRPTDTRDLTPADIFTAFNVIKDKPNPALEA